MRRFFIWPRPCKDISMKITVDYRERRSGLVELLQHHCVVEIDSLTCGDYRINDSVLIERKTARDLLLSIIDQRLFSQIRRMKNLSYRTLLIVEGDPFRTDLDFSPAAIKGALISCQVIWQLPVLFTRSVEETAGTLVTIGRQMEKHDDVILLRGGYRPRRLQTRQLYFLQGLPGVGPTLAKRLLEYFGVPKSILDSTEVELAAVRGIGAQRAALIREILDGQFQIKNSF